jgi:intein/homing endonuclease
MKSDCFPGDTIIHTLAGPRTIEELVSNKIKLLDIYSIKAIGRLNNGGGLGLGSEAIALRLTREEAEIFEVKYEGGSIRLTSEHLVMLGNGTYCSASNLKKGQSLISFHEMRKVYGSKGSASIFDYSIPQPKVLSVEPAGYATVYSLTVPRYHNFAANGIFIHN